MVSTLSNVGRHRKLLSRVDAYVTWVVTDDPGCCVENGLQGGQEAGFCGNTTGEMMGVQMRVVVTAMVRKGKTTFQM